MNKGIHLRVEKLVKKKIIATSGKQKGSQDLTFSSFPSGSVNFPQKNRWEDKQVPKSGVSKLPILVGIKQCKCMVIFMVYFEGFPLE